MNITKLKTFLFQKQIRQIDVLKASKALDRGRLSHIVNGDCKPSEKEKKEIKLALYSLGFSLGTIDRLIELK